VTCQPRFLADSSQLAKEIWLAGILMLDELTFCRSKYLLAFNRDFMRKVFANGYPRRWFLKPVSVTCTLCFDDQEMGHDN
jgi:hypothetical protein